MSFMARQVCEDKSRDMVSSSAGFCYSDGNPAIHIPGFVSDPDMFNLTTGIDMIAFSKNLHHTDTNALKPPHHLPPSSSKTTNFYHNGISEASTDNLFVGAHDSATWPDNRLLVDDSSLRCVFPCEGNERPSQGLSLSLSSTNPLSIGLQSFELRHTQHQQDFVSSACRDKLLGKSVNVNVHEDANVYEGHFMLKHSKYLVAAQELLNEFCSLGTKQSDIAKQRSQKYKQWEDDNGSGASKKQSIGSLEFVELQKRKTKLLSMLEEVDRRYRHYCNQMKAVVSSFEAVAGNGAAAVYSALALKAMSRHFRCLKDGVMGQIEATRKGMGEKDPVAPGTTRGETPKLRIIDQALRQQRAFQQMSIMETHPWRPQRGLPERSVSVLRAWLFEHFLHPYPSDVDKHILARQTGLSRSQVSNWFINARVRLWKPMVEEMYMEEVKEHENNMGSPDGVTDPEDNRRNNVQNLTARRLEDEKPTQERLGRIESECVSSIINNPEHKNESDSLQEQCLGLGRVTETYGSGELDFSSYTHHSAAMVSYSTGGVSLTLGLQQHGGSLFYPRDQIEDCQPVQYSLLDGEAQNLPYRNLMGAQLLHDLA